ncbi:DnaJ domain, zinc finger, CCHC-type, tetratricopeptide-like helical domain protein [Tanacetum coccineum]
MAATTVTMWLPRQDTGVHEFEKGTLNLHWLQSRGRHVRTQANPDNKVREDTLLANTIARFVNVCTVIADATTLTQVKSRHYTAKCLCNRVAAHQALGKIIDAIADCNLAIALDGDYMKRYINVKQTYYISLQPLKGVKPILSPNLNTLALVEVIHQSLQLSKCQSGSEGVQFCLLVSSRYAVIWHFGSH